MNNQCSIILQSIFHGVCQHTATTSPLFNFSNLPYLPYVRTMLAGAVAPCQFTQTQDTRRPPEKKIAILINLAHNTAWPLPRNLHTFICYSRTQKHYYGLDLHQSFTHCWCWAWASRRTPPNFLGWWCCYCGNRPLRRPQFHLLRRAGWHRSGAA
jgi:hypothetical protein